MELVGNNLSDFVHWGLIQSNKNCPLPWYMQTSPPTNSAPSKPKRNRSLSSFDELAGRLMRDAPRGANRHISEEEYLRIMAALKGFKPIDYLEGKARRTLAAWNQIHHRNAVHSFLEAYKHNDFHQPVLVRLKRAEAKYRKAHPEL